MNINVTIIIMQYKSVMEASFESTKELFVAPTIPVAKLKKNNKTSSVTKTKKSKKIVIEDDDIIENAVSNDTNTGVTHDIQNKEGLSYLQTISDNSIDLILTDPPYIISKVTGMNTHYDNVKQNEENDIEFVKSESEWQQYKLEKDIDSDDNKEKYMKYGSIYGKKYCVKTDYGDWDSNFTMKTLESFVCEYYKKLRKGGTLIIFFDIWKISYLKELLEKYKFKQIRFIEWIKTNPQPLNSKVNYLTNCREIALIAVKGSNPTFNSKYDKGIYYDNDIGLYEFPLQGGKARFHPTQKSLLLFEELIKKHSNENDVVLDTFLGSGTTAIASKNANRKCKGCEISKEYYDKMLELLASNM